MNVSELFEQIGQLYMANTTLSKRVAELEKQLAAAKTKDGVKSQTT